MKCHQYSQRAERRPHVFGRVVLPVFMLGLIGQAWGQAAPNLNTDPDFTYGRWIFEGSGGTITRISPPQGSGQSSFNEACIPLSNRPTPLLSTRWEINHFHLPGVASLEKDSLYRLSFYTRWKGVATRQAASKLVATVSGGSRPNIYVERLLSVDGSQRKFDIDFVTPTGESGVPVHTLPTDIAFQAWAGQSGTDGVSICVNKVSLTLLGPNKEVMGPATPAFRYNQVVTGPEDASGNTYFTIINPPAGSSVHVVSASSGTQPLRPRLITQADIVKELHTGWPVVSVPVAFGSSTNKLELRDAGGKVLASTPFLKGTPRSIAYGTLSSGAPTLRRDALHFFYAQRAGQAIIDGRYPEYRNPFSRPAGHLGEMATCFSGKDNFGNDFTGACTTKSGAKLMGRDVSGGWYDAGDHGKYVVNGATALWALHNVIEHETKRGTLNNRYPDGYLGYGLNGRSDLLDEAQHEMLWLLKMQIKPGEEFKPKSTGAKPGPDVFAMVPVGNQDVAFNGRFGVSLDAAVNLQNQATPPLMYPSVNKVKHQLELSRVRVNGMAFSAVRDESWTSLPTAPAADTKARVLDYPTTAATYALAAVAAQCARIWKDIDRFMASRCDDAAKSAWAAAQLNPSIYRYGEYTNSAPYAGHVPAINTGGGAYSDTAVTDQMNWAALELYISNSVAGAADSEEAKIYLRALNKNVGGSNALKFTDYPYAKALSWKHTKNLGLLSLLVNQRDAEIRAKYADAAKIDQSFISLPSKTLVDMGKKYADLVSQTEFGVPKAVSQTGDVFQKDAGPFNWASNADIANQVGMLIQARMYATNQADRDLLLSAAQRATSYLLGSNPLGKSYVTGYGTNPVRNPHHRFWAKHKDIRMPPAPPGMLVGGPNGKYQAALVGANYLDSRWQFASIDPVTQQVGHDRGAEKYTDYVIPACLGRDLVSGDGELGSISCYQDDVDSYMTNEVAINWNSALFWAVAFQ